MYYLYDLSDALSVYTLDCDKEVLESIQRDIGKVTNIYNDKLEFFTKKINKTNKSKFRFFIKKENNTVDPYISIVSINYILHGLPEISTKLSRMEQRALAAKGLESSDVYGDHTISKPKWQMHEGELDFDTISQYESKLNEYLVVKSKQVSSSLTIEDGKRIQQEIKDVLKGMKGLGPVIEGHIKLIEESISEAKDVSYMFGVCRFLYNVMSHMLYLISNMFSNINKIIPDTPQHISGEGMNTDSKLDSYNDIQISKKETASKTELQEGLHSKLDKYIRASKHFALEMEYMESGLNTLSEQIDKILGVTAPQHQQGEGEHPSTDETQEKFFSSIVRKDVFSKEDIKYQELFSNYSNVTLNSDGLPKVPPNPSGPKKS